MPRRSPLLAGLITLVAGTGIVLALNVAPATAEQFATLHPLAGTVEVQNNGRGGFEAAKDEQTLDTGDVLRTGPDGRAEIEYFDGSLTRIDFDTTFVLTELSSLPDEPGSKIIEANQETGNTFNRVVELTGSESRFDIDTPTATASVQGTEYVVKVNPDGTIDFWVLKGAVVAVLENGEREVIGGRRGLTISPDGTTFGPYILTDEQLSDPWLVFNSCELDDGECPPPEVAGITIEPVGEKDTKPKEGNEPSPPPPTPPGDTGTPERGGGGGDGGNGGNGGGGGGGGEGGNGGGQGGNEEGDGPAGDDGPGDGPTPGPSPEPNPPPIAHHSPTLNLNQGQSGNAVLKATDPDGDPLTYIILSGPSHGTLSPGGAPNRFTYTPDPSYTGADSFTWKANDGQDDSNVITFTINVRK